MLDQIRRAIGQAHERQRRPDRLVERRARQAVERAEELEVRARRQLVVEREVLRHESDAPLAGIGVAARAGAVDRHVAARPASAGPAIMATVVVLPAPFGPRRPDDLARRHLEADTSATAVSAPYDLRRRSRGENGRHGAPDHSGRSPPALAMPD